MIDPLTLDLSRIRRVHCLGIGGIGLSAIARMLHAQGKIVSGADASESEITRGLAQLGIQISIGEGESGIGAVPSDVDLVVYTVAIPQTHPSIVDAQARGIPTVTYPQMLAVVSRDKYTIAVAGTHGKTTTTAMVAQILIDAGLDPTVIVGSLLKGLHAADPNAHTNCVIGAGKYFVVEACEYKRSFLNIHPRIAIITNVDADHLDYYKNLEGVQAGFREFVGQVSEALVCDPAAANMSAVVADATPRLINYSEISDATIPRLKIPGAHNVRNAKAALAVARLLGVKDELARASLATFRGTWRRFEFLGTTPRGVLVYDDYGHHPTEIQATLAGARDMFPDKKIVVAFQPHLYSRTKEHLEEFAASFEYADEVIVAPIYAAREPADPTISSVMLAERLHKAGKKVSAPDSVEAVATALRDAAIRLSPGDVLMTMGAGDINIFAVPLVQP